ncbi:MAG: GldG family protein [Bryobacterales bacterium]|nr:GldG family protein [Bryobacteraceae bacterium]MDW8356011.1 GldG family protein [Bryobacterales bacterium]
MRFQWLKARQTKYTAYLTAYLLVILAVLVVTNWLANRHNKSYDFTANKRFSLSDQTEKVVRNLKQDVRIYYFDRAREFDRARDLLGRYDNLSHRLTVAYVDPDRKPQLARNYGVRTYGTIYVETAGRKEEAKSLSEEEITGALIRALKGGERWVCVVTGSGEHSLEETGRNGYSTLKELLEKNNYKTRTISLLEKAEVPKDCTVLLVGGPRYDYTEPAVNAIKTYVESGGRALLMLDPPLKVGKEEISENPALVKLIESWGVTLNKDLALDTSGIGQLFGLSEVVPLVANYEFHPIVREMKEIATAFPIARSLEVKSAEKTTVEKLFSTSSNSYATTNLTSSQVTIDPKRDKKGPLVLGAAGTYNGPNQGRFVVVGCSGWVANNIIRFNGNRDLFLNMMNWLSSDEDLISIRPKEPEDRRLTLTRAQMRRVFYVSVVGFPVLVVAAGLGVWWRRR